MVAKYAGRAMIGVSFFLLIFFYLFQLRIALAQSSDNEVQVVQIHRNLHMKNDENVLHDYYINAGKLHGMREGMIVPVERRLTVQDNFKNIVDDKVMIPVADIKIISVHDKVSIGRLSEEKSREKFGVLEFPKIMTGDRVAVNRASRVPQAVEVEVNRSQIIEAKDAPAAETKPIVPVQAGPVPATVDPDVSVTDDVDLDPSTDPNMRGPASEDSVMRNPNPPKSYPKKAPSDADMTMLIPTLKPE